MPLSAEEKNRILQSYDWIKVKRWRDDPSLPLSERFDSLVQHHEQETEFLIKFIRSLVEDTEGR